MALRERDMVNTPIVELPGAMVLRGRDRGAAHLQRGRQPAGHRRGALQPAAERPAILVADDNSPDGTGDVADRLAERYGEVRMSVVHRPGKQGLGRAYVDGMIRAIEAGAEFVVQIDSDLSHAPNICRRCSAPCWPPMPTSLSARGTWPGPAWPASGPGPAGPVQLRQRLRLHPAAARHPGRHRRLPAVAQLGAAGHRPRQRPQQRLQLPGRDELPGGPARPRRASRCPSTSPNAVRGEEDEPASAAGIGAAAIPALATRRPEGRPEENRSINKALSVGLGDRRPAQHRGDAAGDTLGRSGRLHPARAGVGRPGREY